MFLFLHEQQLVHYDPRKLKPEPQSELLDVYREFKKLKAGDFND